MPKENYNSELSSFLCPTIVIIVRSPKISAKQRQECGDLILKMQI